MHKMTRRPISHNSAETILKRDGWLKATHWPSRWEVRVQNKNKDGTIDHHEVICTHCRKEFTFHRSTSSLKYHINAKHSLVGDSTASSSATPSLRQTLTERRGLSKSTSDKLTDTIAKWIAKNCRPINIVEDTGFTEWS